MHSENDHGEQQATADVERTNSAPNECATTTDMKAHLGTALLTQTSEKCVPNNSDDDGEEEFDVEEALIEVGSIPRGQKNTATAVKTQKPKPK